MVLNLRNHIYWKSIDFTMFLFVLFIVFRWNQVSMSFSHCNFQENWSWHLFATKKVTILHWFLCKNMKMNIFLLTLGKDKWYSGSYESIQKPRHNKRHNSPATAFTGARSTFLKFQKDSCPETICFNMVWRDTKKSKQVTFSNNNVY